MNILSSSVLKGEIDFWKARAETEFCKHVESGSPPYGLFKEDDSFGPLVRYIVCFQCYNEEAERRLSEQHCCADCRQKVPLRGGILWRWYDFYAEQGDEAVFVCNACQLMPKHQARLADDAMRARREQERHRPDLDS